MCAMCVYVCMFGKGRNTLALENAKLILKHIKINLKA